MLEVKIGFFMSNDKNPAYGFEFKSHERAAIEMYFWR